MTYDGEGHRIRLVETPAGANPTVTTTDFTYQGDAVVREVSVTGTTTVTRAFTVDEAGAIVTMTRTTSGGSTANDGTYLVTWNGHGDAIGLARIKGDGTLELANTWTYDTWGEPQPTTSHPNSANSNAAYGDLGFRYLYVGRFDVQWDDYSSAGLLYMHARHYHPELARFLQPDPAALETNLYAYAENSPVTKIDPSGRLFWFVVGVIAVGILIDTTVYIADTPAERRNLPDWAGNAALGIPLSFVPGGKALKLLKWAARFATSAFRMRLLARVIKRDGSLNVSRVVARQLGDGGKWEEMPAQVILDVIGSGKRSFDPQKVAGHYMYRETVFHSGRWRVLEVLVHESTGQIRHIGYRSSGAFGR